MFPTRCVEFSKMAFTEGAAVMFHLKSASNDNKGIIVLKTIKKNKKKSSETSVENFIQ